MHRKDKKLYVTESRAKSSISICSAINGCHVCHMHGSARTEKYKLNINHANEIWPVMGVQFITCACNTHIILTSNIYLLPWELCLAIVHLNVCNTVETSLKQNPGLWL